MVPITLRIKSLGQSSPRVGSGSPVSGQISSNGARLATVFRLSGR